MKQLSLWKEKQVREFGGSLIKRGKRKTERPLSFHLPIHLVLKADDRALLLENAKSICEKIGNLAEKFQIRIYDSAVNADHIHILALFPNREAYNGWVRGLSGRLTRMFPSLKWRLRPYTHVLTWGRQFEGTKKYLALNKMEADFYLNCFKEVESFELRLSQTLTTCRLK